MTPEGYKEHKDTPAFKHWEEGGEIEVCCHLDGNWSIISSPKWDVNVKYRPRVTTLEWQVGPPGEEHDGKRLIMVFDDASTLIDSFKFEGNHRVKIAQSRITQFTVLPK